MHDIREGRMLLGINQKDEEQGGERKVKEAVSSTGVFASSVACFSLWRSRKKCVVFTVGEREKG